MKRSLANIVTVTGRTVVKRWLVSGLAPAAALGGVVGSGVCPREHTRPGTTETTPGLAPTSFRVQRQTGPRVAEMTSTCNGGSGVNLARAELLRRRWERSPRTALIVVHNPTIGSLQELHRRRAVVAPRRSAHDTPSREYVTSMVFGQHP